MSRGIFSKNLQFASYLDDRLAAVKLDGGWKYYDPARCRVSTGTLHWQNEGNGALIATPKAIEWVTLPVTPAGKSRLLRTARLRVDGEGALAGTVSIEYTGQALNDALQDYHNVTAKKISDLVGRREKNRIPACKVSKVKGSSFPPQNTPSSK